MDDLLRAFGLVLILEGLLPLLVPTRWREAFNTCCNCATASSASSAP